ncbi:MAG: PA14 domain-containing protein [Planctomycetota bacterium]|nr:PA14 domain-containing protein [Planctomycetota bacterium]
MSHANLLERRLSPSRGAALVGVVAALVVIQIALTGVILAGARQASLGSARVAASRAFYAAEALNQRAVREIVLQTDEDGDGIVGSVFAGGSGLPLGVGVSLGTLESTSVIQGQNTLTTLIATGYCQDSSRQVRTTLERTPSSDAFAGLVIETWSSSAGLSRLSDVAWSTSPAFVGIVPTIDFPNIGGQRWPGGPTGRYGVRLSGSINIPTSGLWTFSTSSDDGSDLSINGVRIVDNDGLHSNRTRSGTVFLPAGQASIVVRWFENSGSSNLQALWQGPGVPNAIVPASAFSCEPAFPVPPVAIASTITAPASGATAVIVDAYDASAGAYSATTVRSGIPMSINSSAAGAWSASGDAQFRVDPLVGPGASPSSVLSISPPASVSGTSGNLQQRVPILNITPPTLTSSGALNLTSPMTINSNRRFTTLSATGASAVLTLSGNITVVVDADLSVSGGASIELAPSSTVRLFVGGHATIGTGSGVNASGADPRRLTIFMVGSAREFRLDGTSLVYADVTSAFGSLVFQGTAPGIPRFFGNFRGNALSINQRGWIHANTARSGGSTGARVRLASWTQER